MGRGLCSVVAMQAPMAWALRLSNISLMARLSLSHLIAALLTLGAERNRTPLDLEAGAIVWAIKRLRERAKFCILSDNSALQNMAKISEHNPTPAFRDGLGSSLHTNTH